MIWAEPLVITLFTPSRGLERLIGFRSFAIAQDERKRLRGTEGGAKEISVKFNENSCVVNFFSYLCVKETVL